MRVTTTISIAISAFLALQTTNAIVTPKPPSSTRLFASDPTALFNSDILRIASRTSNKQSNFNPIHAADHAHRMLVQMLDMYEKSDRKTAKPNTETFRIVLKAFANLGGAIWEDGDTMSIDAVERMERVFDRLNEFNKDQGDGGEGLTFTTEILNIILKAYARCGQQEIPPASFSEDTVLCAELPWLQSHSERGSNAERAEKVLNYMLQHQATEPGLAPNMQTYAFAIQAWSRQQSSSKRFLSNPKHRGIQKDVCVKRASKWLPELESMYGLEAGADNSIVGNKRRNARRVLLWAYSDVLDAWARSDVKMAPKQSNEYMTRIEELSAEDVKDVERIKTQRTEVEQELDNDEENGKLKYNTYVYGQQDIDLFDEKDEFLHPEYPLYPSDQSYTSAILALSRSRDKGADRRAHQLLNNMLDLYDSGNWFKNRPNLLAFNTVITSYSKSSEPGSADSAEKILNKLERLYFDPDKPHYDYLKPDVISYNAAVTAWSRVNEEAAVYNAEKIVKRMECHFDAVGDNFLDVEPDAYTYNALINAWIRSGLGVTSADKAEAILRLMIDKFDKGDKRFVPNQKTFCQIINAWGKCGNGEEVPVKRAIGLINQMETMYNEGVQGLKPDMITYSSVIDTIAKTRLPRGSDIAMELIEKMEDMYLNGDKDMRPSVRSYSSLLLTLVHSERADKHDLAQQVLDRMKKLGVHPNSYSYNYVINCAANCRGESKLKMEAFKVALRAFTSLRKSSQETDTFTYTFFLKACGNLMEPSSMRSKIVAEVFLECRKEGKVNNEVISRLTGCLDPHEARVLLGTKGQIRKITVDDLNPKWSFNTRTPPPRTPRTRKR